MISILIPARNEEQAIIPTLEEVIAKVKIPYEIIVINDCSSDGTVKKVAEFRRKHQQVKLISTIKGASGFSPAIKLGVEKSKGFAAVPVMGDICDDPATINRMYDKMVKENWDIVCGSRYAKGGKKIGGPKMQGVLSKLVCNFLHLLGLPTRDATNAFKLYRRQILEKVRFNPKSGVELSMELVLQAHYLMGARITDVATSWRGRTSGQSKFKVVQRAPRYLRACTWALFNSLRQLVRMRLLPTDFPN